MYNPSVPLQFCVITDGFRVLTCEVHVFTVEVIALTSGFRSNTVRVRANTSQAHKKQNKLAEKLPYKLRNTEI